MPAKSLEHLVDVEEDQLKKLGDMVQQAIEEEKLLSEKLLEFEDRNPSRISRVADKVAAFGGSWKFILTFSLLMVA